MTAIRWISCLVSVGALSLPAACAAPTTTSSTTSAVIDATVTSAGPVLQPGTSVELVYDEVLGQMVLVNGGPQSGKPAGAPVEIWGWDGKAWSLLSADVDGPEWRNGMSVAYDAAHGQLVLFGGAQDRRAMRDMWLWDGDVWTEVDTPLPPCTGGGSGIAYDADRERIVLFGGADAQFNLLGETWEWDGSTWTLMSTEGPAARFPGAMTYDAGRHEVLLYGGHAPSDSGAINWGDTWGWNGTSWHEYAPPEPLPGIRAATRASYDGNSDVVLLFGGVEEGDTTVPVDDTWAWDGSTWKLLDVLGPTPRELVAMAYDSQRKVVMLFGGFEEPPYLGTPPKTDTWEFDGVSWRCVAGCA